MHVYVYACENKIRRHRLHGPAADLQSAAAVPERTTAFPESNNKVFARQSESNV